MGMGRTGQVELFAVVGIIVVVVVAVYFSYQSGLFGTASLASLSESQKLVKDSVDSFIMSGTLESLGALSESGGVENPADSVTFLNKEVPYWYRNGVKNIPDFSAALRDKLTEYLRDNKDAFAGSFSKAVSLGEPSVFVTMLPDRVDIVANMPTIVDGEALPQPYRVTVKTNIGKAYEYGKGFVNANSKDRFLEVFTTANMIISPIEDGINSVPVSVSLYECGGYVYRSWEDIQPAMDFLIKSTLANTYIFRGSPKGDYESSPAAQYEIPPFDFNNYNGINLSFHLPDSFELDRSNFQFTPEPIIAMAKPIPMVGACVSDPLLVNYFVKYPAIVRIRDGVTGNILQFAVEVSIKDNKPAAAASGYQTEASDCDYKLCSVKVTVNSAGKPVQYASASFFGCEIGKSDENGVIEGTAVCGAAGLNVYRSGYAPLAVSFSSTGPDNVTAVELRKMLRIPVYLHMVNVQKGFGSYLIEGHEFGLSDLDSKAAQVELIPNEDGRACDSSYCTRIFKKTDGVMSNIPEGEYVISAGLLSTNFQTTYGMIVYPYTINSTKTLHIYLPYTVDFLSASDDNVITANKALEMSRLLLKCNITPVTDVPVDINNFGGCSVPYEQVQ